MSVRFRTGWSVNSNRNQSVKWIMNMINQWAQFIDKVRPGFSRHSARFRGNIPRFISHKAKQVHFKGNIPCPLSHQQNKLALTSFNPFPAIDAYIEYRSKESYHPLARRELPHTLRNSCRSLRDSCGAGHDSCSARRPKNCKYNSIMAKILERFQESMVKLYRY